MGLLGLALAGGLYYLFIRLTGWWIPCVFQKLTGLACPGCGMTHFCSEAARLDLAGAAGENLAVALLIPVWAVFLIASLFRKDRSRRLTETAAFNVLAWGSIGILLIFGVLRNLKGFEFLLPSYMRT